MTFVKSLHIYPLKSCRGIDIGEARLTHSGLEWDRNWMLVDRNGLFISQREHPNMALIAIALDADAMRMGAPGMPPLKIALHGRERARRRVFIWEHEGHTFDEGDAAAKWFGDFLGTHCRLVAFDAAERRTSDRNWTGPDEALNRFSDGFPILVANAASLAELNARLSGPIPMSLFRPNIVIDGVAPYDEDHVDTLSAGSIVLRLVKPCTRCEITTTDQDTGQRGVEPLETLSTYRANPRMGGGITFGQNAIVKGGIGVRIAVGMPLAMRWTF
ncbi:MAG: MOSC domain-containing protein [Betaproteobacteria bacterium]|nr:MOSC domain-containing protein [Betaproteobacteria bacterium]